MVYEYFFSLAIRERNDRGNYMQVKNIQTL